MVGLVSRSGHWTFETRRMILIGPYCMENVTWEFDWLKATYIPEQLLGEKHHVTTNMIGSQLDDMDQ